MKFLFHSACFSLAVLPIGMRLAAQTAPPLMDSDRYARTTVLGKVPDWKVLDSFQKVFTHEEFTKVWKEIYSAENALPPPFQITAEALVIPTGDPLQSEFRLAFRAPSDPPPALPSRYWRKASELPPLRGRPPLSDLHIALDPGHIGGTWARMEERFLSFQPGESIQEGDLSLLTAQVLKARLSELGAVVTLVRDKLEPVTDQRPEDLRADALELLRAAGVRTPRANYEGVTGDAKVITVQWQMEKLFYRVSEIHARAQRVNEQIKPDLVLCLHFNAESWGAADAPQFSPKNHLHVLVNGCYAPVELEQQDIRFEMLARLFNRVHESEIPLANSIATGMARRTGLPPYAYTTPNARRINDNPFVYARNLLANRLYQCPVVYLEPYVMNHEETYHRLRAGHYLGRTLIRGKLTTSAIEDYARGVIEGLLKHYQSQRQSS